MHGKTDLIDPVNYFITVRMIKITDNYACVKFFLTFFWSCICIMYVNGNKEMMGLPNNCLNFRTEPFKLSNRTL